MTRIVIIEDEPLAAEHLQLLIHKVRPEVRILTILSTVKDALEWLKKNSDFDLLFSDIQLGDGICFEIFQQVQINVPIVFTTAYDQYALEAFKVNGIDYLLKPIDGETLEAAFRKIESLQQVSNPKTTFGQKQLRDLLQAVQKGYKKRFAVKIGSQLKMIHSDDILYFKSQHKITYLVTEEGKKYPLDYTLLELIDLLDPDHFFRINRQIILRDQSIKKISAITNSRLKVTIPFEPTEVIVSRERCQEFKEWLDS